MVIMMISQLLLTFYTEIISKTVTSQIPTDAGQTPTPYTIFKFPQQQGLKLVAICLYEWLWGQDNMKYVYF